MEATGRHSASPEDCSDGNDSLSAPSEFLAEFLSAIMRRQYAEALKYCRLILQYEPHNATARGFYPLLLHRLRYEPKGTTAGTGAAAVAGADAAAGAGADQLSSSEEASGRSGRSAAAAQDEQMEQAADDDGDGSEESSGGSVASQSSLELDSEPSLELSRRTDSASGCCSWESTGSASRSEPDDNGNAQPSPPRVAAAAAAAAVAGSGDLENDNAGAGGGVAASGEPHHTAHLKDESLSSLRRLRAQFACAK